MCLSVRRSYRLAASLTAAALLTSCIAVGPDFLHPAAFGVYDFPAWNSEVRVGKHGAVDGLASRALTARRPVQPRVELGARFFCRSDPESLWI